MYKNMFYCVIVHFSLHNLLSWFSTMVSTQSLRWPEVQQVTRGGCFVHWEVWELRWEQEKWLVRLASAQPGSHYRASSPLGKCASLSCFCKASVGLKQRGSACWSVQVQACPSEVHRGWRRWSGSRRPPGGWEGEFSPQCSPPHTWTGNGWPLQHTHWTQLCIYPGRRGLCSQQL